MCAKWNKSYDPSALASGLEQLKISDGDQHIGKVSRTGDKSGVSFDSYYFADYRAVLLSSVSFGLDLPASKQQEIVNNAVFNVAANKKLTAQAIIREISKLEEEFRDQPSKRYTLLSSWSVTFHPFLTRRLLNGALITFSDRHPTDLEQTDIGERFHRYLGAQLPTDYTQLRVFVDARDESEAAELAFNGLHLLRAIWNYYYNRSKWSRMTMSKNEPVNDIILGPLHVLEQAQHRWWYDPNYTGALKCKDLKKDWANLKKFETWARKKLAQISYRSNIEDTLRKYADALDDRDLNTAYIKLWGTLEHLTDTTGKRYDISIKRTAFLYPDDGFHIQVLNHLRDYRNKTVHMGERSDDVELLVFQLKRYVERLIWYHLTSGHNFENLSKASDFLDLPKDPALLTKRIKLYQKGHELRQALR